MVKPAYPFLISFFLASLISKNTMAETESLSEVIFEKIGADACDDKHSDDDVKMAENRAIDKASLSAVKLSGVIQKQHPNLGTHSLDLITYRIVDEHLEDVEKDVTLNDENRVCVKIHANLRISEDELNELIHEYKRNEVIEGTEVVEVAEKVQDKIRVRPSNEQDRKLVYIDDMVMWNDSHTDHYTPYLTELFSHSEYYYVTQNKALADFVIIPELAKADVDVLDEKNHKMHMVVKLSVEDQNEKAIEGLGDQQNHFTLFEANDNEQNVADKLIIKLLNRSVVNINNLLEKQIQKLISK